MLERTWDDALPGALIVGLNPSTADETTDDPTIRRCIGFAKEWGCGGVRVLNLFAFCATRPEDLWKARDPVGEDNDRWLQRASREARLTVAAWGVHGHGHERAATVIGMLARPLCLGLTKDGAPRHPLYVKAGTVLRPVA